MESGQIQTLAQAIKQGVLTEANASQGLDYLFNYFYGYHESELHYVMQRLVSQPIDTKSLIEYKFNNIYLLVSIEMFEKKLQILQKKFEELIPQLKEGKEGTLEKNKLLELFNEYVENRGFLLEIFPENTSPELLKGLENNLLKFYKLDDLISRVMKDEKKEVKVSVENMQKQQYAEILQKLINQLTAQVSGLINNERKSNFLVSFSRLFKTDENNEVINAQQMLDKLKIFNTFSDKKFALTAARGYLNLQLYVQHNPKIHNWIRASSDKILTNIKEFEHVDSSPVDIIKKRS